MRIFFLLLYILTCFFSSNTYSNESIVSSVDQIKVKIIIIDKWTQAKNEVIKDLLSLQSSLIMPVKNALSENAAKKGFLLIRMTHEYVNDLLENKNGKLVAAYDDQKLVGYIILTEVSEFKELYQDKTIGYIETNIDEDKLEKALSKKEMAYIEQIGVDANFSRTGIGSKLINICKKIKPDGLIADVFIEPLINNASLHFFLAQGFERSGILHQHPRVNFPYAHKTQVFFWNIHPK